MKIKKQHPFQDSNTSLFTSIAMAEIPPETLMAHQNMQYLHERARALPLYNKDWETQGEPEVMEDLSMRLDAAYLAAQADPSKMHGYLQLVEDTYIHTAKKIAVTLECLMEYDPGGCRQLDRHDLAINNTLIDMDTKNIALYTQLTGYEPGEGLADMRDEFTPQSFS